ncbi:MAG TPA: Na/Pi symporter [Mariprofundaceae bacterium]|nr:Na/Pi symporter [Mariprofundaceae bacterium]
MTAMINGLLGGIGLFLLGMHLMTEGLKLAAGNSLRRILANSTRTPLAGIASGMLITSVVQSSSAVTVATIGFVNAGLLTLLQAATVIYGSNIGTTMTGWLVAILGFHVDIQLLALPAIGIGAFLWLFARGWQKHAGQALAGFGLFFFGIDLLRTAFTGLDQSVNMQALYSGSLLNHLLFLGIGFVLTMLMQSSSASMALTLTAAGSGWIPLPAAAMMVIGANLGTTSTAAIAVIGATPNAKRAAAVHVLFNLITAVVAIIILPLLLWAVVGIGRLIEAGSQPATLLALFHTMFNLLGVALMWPLTRRVVADLEQRFRAAEEDESKPKYLDATIAGMPVLAQQALVKEIARIAAIARRMAKDATSTEASISERLVVDQGVLLRLVDAVDSFTSKMREGALPGFLAEALPGALSATRYYKSVGDLAADVDRMQSVPTHLPAELETAMAEFRSGIVRALDATDAEAEGFDLAGCHAQDEALDDEYERLKTMLLKAGTKGEVPLRIVVEHIELLKTLSRLLGHMIKGSQDLMVFGGAHAVEAKAPEAAAEPAEANAPVEPADSK